MWELKKCMAPLMRLNGDVIVETSLLEPVGNEPRTSPTPEAEATHLGEELELLEATASLQECLETPKPKEPIKQIDTPSTPIPSSPTSKPCHHPSQKTNISWKKMEPQSLPTPDLDITSDWVQAYIKKSGEYQTGGGNSVPFATGCQAPQ